MKVRTRFAPSPTGQLHIGNLRTAIYAYALARHNSGNFILRIEDTDRKRYVPEAVEYTKNLLKTFGMNWDEYYVQSERKEQGVYAKYAKQLVDSGHAFYCQCAAKNAKKDGFSKELRDPCRDKNLTSGAIKLKVPENELIKYHDFVFREDIEWNTDAVFDATLLKTDGFPTYHLAVVVDDHEMNITHVLRGYDWMSSTPIHLLVYKCLGFQPPEIGHLTDIQATEGGGKLSKRRGAKFVDEYLTDGFLPEALLNFIIMMGWAPKDNRELYTLVEFVANFREDGFQKSNPRYVPDKLNWFNQQYIKKLSLTDLTDKLTDFTNTDKETVAKLLPLVRDRLVTLKDFDELTGYFFEKPEKQTVDPKIISHAASVLEKEFDGKVLETEARKFCTENNLKVGDYFMALRLATTGKSATPPLWDVMMILGKEESLARLKVGDKQ